MIIRILELFLGFSVLLALSVCKYYYNFMHVWEWRSLCTGLASSCHVTHIWKLDIKFLKSHPQELLLARLKFWYIWQTFCENVFEKTFVGKIDVLTLLVLNVNLPQFKAHCFLTAGFCHLILAVPLESAMPVHLVFKFNRSPPEDVQFTLTRSPADGWLPVCQNGTSVKGCQGPLNLERTLILIYSM